MTIVPRAAMLSETCPDCQGTGQGLDAEGYLGECQECCGAGYLRSRQRGQQLLDWLAGSRHWAELVRRLAAQAQACEQGEALYRRCRMHASADLLAREAQAYRLATSAAQAVLERRPEPTPPAAPAQPVSFLRRAIRWITRRAA